MQNTTKALGFHYDKMITILDSLKGTMGHKIAAES